MKDWYKRHKVGVTDSLLASLIMAVLGGLFTNWHRLLAITIPLWILICILLVGSIIPLLVQRVRAHKRAKEPVNFDDIINRLEARDREAKDEIATKDAKIAELQEDIFFATERLAERQRVVAQLGQNNVALHKQLQFLKLKIRLINVLIYEVKTRPNDILIQVFLSLSNSHQVATNVTSWGLTVYDPTSNYIVGTGVPVSIPDSLAQSLNFAHAFSGQIDFWVLDRTAQDLVRRDLVVALEDGAGHRVSSEPHTILDITLVDDMP